MTQISFGALERLFPYEVLAKTHELMMHRITEHADEDITEYRFANPIWLFDHDEKERQKLFAKFRKSVARGQAFFPQMHHIIEVEPFGDVLILDLAFDASQYETFLDAKRRVGVPLAFIGAQYYAEDGTPQLRSGMTATDFAQVERDEDRLVLVAIEFTEQHPVTSVIKTPPDMLDRWSVAKDEQDGDA